MCLKGYFFDFVAEKEEFFEFFEMRDVFDSFDVVVGKIEDFQIGEVFESFDLEKPVVVEFEFSEIRTEVKSDDFLDEIVSEIKCLDVGRIDCMLLDGSNSTTYVIDFLC